MVQKLKSCGNKPFAIRDDEKEVVDEGEGTVRTAGVATPSRDQNAWLAHWKERMDEIALSRSLENEAPQVADVSDDASIVIVDGSHISFRDVSIVTPDGKLLVEGTACEGGGGGVEAVLADRGG